MKQCIKCGHELADEAVFCHICGEKQVQSENNSGNTLHVDNQTPQAVKVENRENDGCLGNNMKLITASLYLLIVLGIGLFLYRISSEEKQIEKQIDKYITLEWSKKSKKGMKWQDAESYCVFLVENGHNDWRLPTISELRTLIVDCPKTEIGGECAVTDSCLDNQDCGNDACTPSCYVSYDGLHSRFRDTGRLWSSSTCASYIHAAWYVGFDGGNVGSDLKTSRYYVRCVRDSLIP